MKHPQQPMVIADNGVVRFKTNKIVRHLLDHGSINLNQIACLPFDLEDRMQLYQLIGYSVGGFGEIYCEEAPEEVRRLDDLAEKLMDQTR